MIFLLSQHICAHPLQTRSAHRESPETLLPGKTAQSKLLTNSARRLALEFTHHIGQAMSRAQTSQDMNMISRSADRVRRAVHASNDTAEVLVNTDARRRRKPWFAIFRANDEVIMQGEMRRRHEGISRAPAGAQFARLIATGGYGRRGDLHHRLLSLVPLGRNRSQPGRYVRATLQ